MSKRLFPAGNMLNPLPAVLVSCIDKDGNTNVMTAAWTGTICSEPPMLYVSIRKERYSHHMIKETGEFVVNLTTEKLAKAMDYCGVKSGRDEDKWETAGLTREKASKVSAPLVKESPVNIECKVTQVLELGSHDMFVAEVLAVDVDEEFFDKNDKFDLDKTHLVAYSHGEYLKLGEKIGTFGYSVRKKPLKKKRK